MRSSFIRKGQTIALFLIAILLASTTVIIAACAIMIAVSNYTTCTYGYAFEIKLYNAIDDRIVLSAMKPLFVKVAVDIPSHAFPILKVKVRGDCVSLKVVKGWIAHDRVYKLLRLVGLRAGCNASLCIAVELQARRFIENFSACIPVMVSELSTKSNNVTVYVEIW